jgi:hypothetical protein
MDQLKGARNRKHLLDSNLEKIEAAYAVAGSNDAVVIVADARDGLGETLSKDHNGELQHEELLAHCKAQGMTPTLILALPRQTASDLLGGSTTKTDRMLDKPALPGYFRVIVIGEQGIMFGEVAIPGRTVMN